MCASWGWFKWQEDSRHRRFSSFDLSTWDGPERTYLKHVLTQLHDRYPRYVEPCAGAFVGPLVASESAYTPDQIESSEVWLFTSVLGALLAGEDLASLGVKRDGQPLELEGDPIRQAAQILYTQLVARMDAKPPADYWLSLARDLEERRTEHIDGIVVKLKGLTSRLQGIKYQPMSLWDHIFQVVDDPNAVVVMNPPTYRGAYEKFFYTEYLTWDEPEYAMFDPMPDQVEIQKAFDGRPALLLVQQQAPPKESANDRPVYARHLSAGQNVYIMSNRPDEVMALTNGRPVVKTRTPTAIDGLEAPTAPMDFEFRDKAIVEVRQIKTSQAAYYKEMWLHRIPPKHMGENFAVLVDGYLVGIGALDLSPITSPYSAPDSPLRQSAMMVYALGSPHEQMRTTRLATRLCLHRPMLDLVFNRPKAWQRDIVEHVVTSEFTQHPEAKGLRGLMKLHHRDKTPDGNKLLYICDVGTETPAESYAKWLADERKYLKNREKQATANAAK